MAAVVLHHKRMNAAHAAVRFGRKKKAEGEEGEEGAPVDTGFKGIGQSAVGLPRVRDTLIYPMFRACGFKCGKTGAAGEDTAGTDTAGGDEVPNRKPGAPDNHI